MLSAEAVRLVAVETLCPTAAITAGTGFPTLAGKRIFDSRPATLSEIDNEAQYTPVLSVYTRRSSFSLHGSATDADDTVTSMVLDIVAELAVVARDTDPTQPAYVDAMADGDPTARLVLAALAAQVRYLLTHGAAGKAWRQLVREVIRVDEETFAVPEFGLRFQRMMLSFELSIREDRFDMANGGLPEPLRSVHAALPAQSYAKAKLTELAGHFVGEPPDVLSEIAGTANLPGATDLTIGAGNLG